MTQVCLLSSKRKAYRIIVVERYLMKDETCIHEVSASALQQTEKRWSL